jgi:hypothetical protein
MTAHPSPAALAMTAAADARLERLRAQHERLTEDHLALRLAVATDGGTFAQRMADDLDARRRAYLWER